MNEIVLPKNGIDPDFDSRFHFETPVSEMIGEQDLRTRFFQAARSTSEQLQDAEFSRKLEQVVQAKQEAVAKQMQYWQKLDEFRKESQLLRKHVGGCFAVLSARWVCVLLQIEDPSVPLPPPTICTLQQPVEHALPSSRK